jgi:L,D-transpeptidase YcbB
VFPTWRPDDTSPPATALRARLVASGDLPAPAAGREVGPGAGPDSIFDAALEQAVRRMQMRHGLEIDGWVGPQTLRALGVPIEDRIRQIERNLAARRAFSEARGRTRILINIPAFEAWILREGLPADRHRVIVGRTDRRTPVLAATMKHIVLAPYWTVPPGILRRDLLPQIRQDPALLQRRRIRVLDRVTGREIDPARIDWEGLAADVVDARYLFRQDPGPWNALGQVKFIFPNPHLVYLHDTPDRHLFEEVRRTFSSGCIRIEGALTLASQLLQEQLPDWDAARVRQVASGPQERWIALAEPIPVQTVYWTAWVTEDGILHFAEDFYGWDRRPASMAAGQEPEFTSVWPMANPGSASVDPPSASTCAS